MYRQGFRRFWCCAFLLTLLAMLLLGNLVLATPYTVTITNDSGDNSLRWALTNANFIGGSNTINFNISGTKPFTITLLSPLPVANYPLTIDGTTQTGYSNTPVVELNGTNAGASAVGLQLTGFSTVKGLAINRFNGPGILLVGVSNVVQGSFIGTDTTGTNALANTNKSYGCGILLSNAVSCQIGGTNAGERNVISGNNASGLYLLGSGTTGNLIQGNYIGTELSGSLVVSNGGDGITINGAPGNIIGFSNVISGNVFDGVSIYGRTAASNVIVGNFIGTDATGKSAKGNGYYGLYLTNAVACQLGGSGNAGNIISGNIQHGVFIDSGSSGNFVQGNLIGVARGGTNALPNGTNALINGDGVIIIGSFTNTIGGSTNLGNIISGNFQHGIVITGGSFSNSVQGNLIGVARSGTNALPNQGDGIIISGGSTNTIGGTALYRNVISGNGGNGVEIRQTNDCFNVIQGNFIGTTITGLQALSNTLSGIYIHGCTNTVGGQRKSGLVNVISGNGQYGIVLISTNSESPSGNIISGNNIGLDATGANSIGNGNSGIGIFSAAGNQIGGNSSNLRNYISANGFSVTNAGIYFYGPGTTSNLIQGNYIGTDSTGAIARPNASAGIYATAVGSNTIGGSATSVGNIISGNSEAGIWLNNTTNFVIQGNYIGLNAAGTGQLGNGLSGLWPGILILSTTATNWIGGTTAAARNVISGNNSKGIILQNCAAQVIQGNYIGTDAGGSYAVHNGGHGISLVSSVSNIIGGTVTGAGNVVSGNNTLDSNNLGYDGIYLTNSSQNIIQGNFIGLAADGVSALTNSAHNVEFYSGSTNNILGGLATGAGNRIAFAAGGYDGVRVRTNAYNNLISGNSIFSNTGLGIDLGNYGTNGIIPLESGVASTNANRLQNYPTITNVITGSATLVRGTFDSVTNRSYSLEFFASPSGNASGCGEGKVFLGQTNLALGNVSPTNFSFVLPATVPTNWVVTATATDSNNNTSEFSRWLTTAVVPPLQVRTNSVSRQFTISWATNSSGSFILMQSTNLNPPRWVTTGGSPVFSNGTFSVLLRATNPATFYRLLVQ